MIEMILNLDFTPFVLSFKLALVTTIILFIISLPYAWYLSQTKSKYKPILESITALPIVLPPSVLGFYILIALSSANSLGIDLAFSFKGLVIASCLYSLPFMVQPLQNGFEMLDKNILEASYIAGKSKFTTIKKIAIPNIKSSILTAIIITFAHTVGEFGVVLMVGGNIPHETKVVSVAIYELVESMDYSMAHIYSGIMVLLSFFILLLVYIFNRKTSIKLKSF